LHHVGVSLYFVRKMHGQTTLKMHTDFRFKKKRKERKKKKRKERKRKEKPLGSPGTDFIMIMHF